VFRTFEKIASGVAQAANAAGTLVVVLLIAVVNYDIVARGIFNKPFLGAVEVVQFSMVLIVFLQLPDVVRINRLVSATFMAIVAWAIWPEFLDMWETKDYFGVPGVFTAPWWPIKLVIFLSACLCIVHFALRIIKGPTPPTSDDGLSEKFGGDGSIEEKAGTP
jgi:TRAP-type C4-dicarboxylate transport system permease small subunit